MKKVILMLGLIFGLMGCADTITDNGTGSGTGSGGGTSAETLANVDNAFYKEYAKHITGAVDAVSSQAETNIKSLLQNITGRGKMPASVGIGEVSSVITSSAMAKKISVLLSDAGADAGAKALLDYATLDVPANTFLQSVMGALMGGTTGTNMLASLKLYQQNQQAVEKLTLAHLNKFGVTTDNDNVTVNLAYLYASLTDYFTDLNITALPADDTTINSLVDVIYNHCSDGVNNILATYDKATSEFTVMPVLTCGAGMPAGINTMVDFMNKVGKVFDPNYSYSITSPAVQ